MKIDYQGQVYDLDMDAITNKQALKILQFTGQPSLSKWLEACATTDSPAYIPSVDALYWAMLKQNGDTTTALDDVDYQFGHYVDAFLAGMAAEKPEDETEAEPDPTQPAADSAPSPVPSSRNRTSTTPAAGEASPDG